jgi:hypothetical protein
VIWLGINPEPVQDDPCRPKILSQGPAVQGSRSAHQLRTSSVLQSRRGGLLCAHRGALPPAFPVVITILTRSGEFSCVQAFFPKNRNRWKRYSTWEPENKAKKTKEANTGLPPDVEVKKGFSWSEQLAIAMAALQDAGQSELIEWVKEVCLSMPDSPGAGVD